MHPVSELQHHHELMSSVVRLMLTCCNSSNVEEHSASLKVACEKAISSLNSDLLAIAEMDERFERSYGLCRSGS